MNNTSHNRNITIDSKTHTFAEWLKIIEVKKPNVYKNSKKQSMSVEEYLKKRYYAKKNIACLVETEIKRPEMQDMPARMVQK